MLIIFSGKNMTTLIGSQCYIEW